MGWCSQLPPALKVHVCISFQFPIHNVLWWLEISHCGSIYTRQLAHPTDEGNIISESQVLNIYQHTTTQNPHLKKN